jgi:hypothetical protein
MSSRLIVALLACAACATPSRDAAVTSDTNAPAVSQAPPADTTPREIYIDSVIPGNPLVVYGRARTFENNVQVRVRSAAGDSLAQRFTTSVGEMGHHNPFVVEIPFANDPGPKLIVEAFEYSAKDGSIRSLIRREVVDRSRNP